MKRHFFILVFMICVLSWQVFSQRVNETQGNAGTSQTDKAVITWKSTTHDFGKIPKGKPVSVEYEFKNESMIPVIIQNVRASCGCTATDYPKEPVKPFQTAKIKAIYNAAAVGQFSKSVTVTLNTESGSEILILKGEVIGSVPVPPTTSTPVPQPKQSVTPSK